MGPTPEFELFPPIRTERPIFSGSQVTWSQTSLQRPQPMHFFWMISTPTVPSLFGNDLIAFTGQTIWTSGVILPRTSARMGRQRRTRFWSKSGAAP